MSQHVDFATVDLFPALKDFSADALKWTDLEEGVVHQIAFASLYKEKMFSASRYMEMLKFEKLWKWKIIISKGGGAHLFSFKGGSTWKWKIVISNGGVHRSSLLGVAMS